MSRTTINIDARIRQLLQSRKRLKHETYDEIIENMSRENANMKNQIRMIAKQKKILPISKRYKEMLYSTQI